MMNRDYEYYARREQQERDHAKRADDTTARRVHQEMAERYLAKLRDLAVSTAA
ncbi:hypothetical protein AB2M62_15325 [Sphingomonas sp. MMS12-HWE2-04]|uniref:hypothetical protein n=1 Tax=Sphingomonas sp. MMS12-HWE2-04 TaxID=3234199 RepID=UPI00384C280B